jgi:hypothetical protein
MIAERHDNLLDRKLYHKYRHIMFAFGPDTGYSTRSVCHSLLRLGRFVARGVQLSQPVEGLMDAQLSATLFGDGLLARLHFLVALEQQRLGIGLLLLSEQRPAEH